MTKTTFATLDDHQQAGGEWYIVDASEHVFGRMASRIAEVLMGKHKPNYTPHISVGSGVVVINSDRIGVTGSKKETRVYTRYTGHMGGLRKATLGERIEHESDKLMKEAVRRMLPKTRMGHDMLRRLKVYRGAEHPHAAQNPQPLPMTES